MTLGDVLKNCRWEQGWSQRQLSERSGVARQTISDAELCYRGTGDYEPNNITFIPKELQQRNTTRSVQITYKGLTLCAAEWAEILGFNQNTLTKRKRSGWSDERTLETPCKDSIDVTLIPTEIIRAIREVRLFGVKKYSDPDNWKQVEVERYRDALCRHLLEYIKDPKSVDAESGIPHYKHMACNMAFICEMEQW